MEVKVTPLYKCFGISISLHCFQINNNNKKQQLRVVGVGVIYILNEED